MACCGLPPPPRAVACDGDEDETQPPSPQSPSPREGDSAAQGAATVAPGGTAAEAASTLEVVTTVAGNVPLFAVYATEIIVLGHVLWKLETELARWRFCPSNLLYEWYTSNERAQFNRPSHPLTRITK